MPVGARQTEEGLTLTPKQPFERAKCASRCGRNPPLEGQDIMLCPGEGIVIPKKSGTTRFVHRVSLGDSVIFYFSDMFK